MVSLTLLPKTLVLVLAITFSIVITGYVQEADAFSVSGKRLVFEMQVGETEMQEWMIKNKADHEIKVEIYTLGDGSELLTFQKYYILQPGDRVTPEIFVIIPDDHPDNIEYHIELFGLVRGSLPEGATGVVVNNQAKNFIDIKIGDNPIYTAPPPDLTPGLNPALQPAPKVVIPAPVVEEVIEETLEEKLERIQKANEATQVTPQVEAIDKPEIKEDVEYMPEPVMDDEPVTTQVALPSCGIWEMILSIFGIKSDCI